MSLALIQDKLVDLIKADSYFDGIEVLSEKVGDLENKIEQSLAKLNVAVIVLPPVAEMIDSKSDRVSLIARLSVAVVENVLLNSSGKRALEIASKVMTVAHGKNNGIGPARSSSSEFHLSDQALDPVPSPNSQLVAYNVNFQTQITLN
jgi:hypothetical protein